MYESSEVRVEGLETLDYIDNSLHKERFTEQADALTFDGEVYFLAYVVLMFKVVSLLTRFYLQVNRVYLNTPPKIAVIDHGKKRTFVVHKQGLPDAG